MSTEAPELPDSMVESNIQTQWNKNFEATAHKLTPKLKRWRRLPQSVIKFQSDDTEYFKVKAIEANSLDELPSLEWGKGGDFILDFGIHMVGYVSFKLTHCGAAMDAPCRLRLTFGESPLDVTLGMNNVNTWISTSWTPEEVINIDFGPETVSLPRRYSFRFLRIEIIDTSPKYKVCFSNITCECVSMIGQQNVIDDVHFEDSLLQIIDQVSLSTLRDCMQTVYEDGPRRDRRLWIGDLRVQALTNYCTFNDYDLVKRCLYLFASVPRIDGSIPACVFEKPTFQPSTDYIVDYDALFAATVYDYVVASGDLKAGHELWETVQGCLKRPLSYLDPETNTFNPNLRKDSWIFLDWAQNLDHAAGAHGVLLFSLKSANALAFLLSKPEPYVTQVTKMSAAATTFLDRSTGLFTSNSQISYASAAWLVLSGAFPKDIARSALLSTIAHPNAIKPLTPYLWHHVADALTSVDCFQEALDLIKSYWGGMVNAGADTFWEAFDPLDAKASPYGDVRNNSFCHAWSCSASYMLRGKLKEYAQGRTEGQVSVRDLDERWIERTRGLLVG